MLDLINTTVELKTVIQVLLVGGLLLGATIHMFRAVRS